MLGWLPNAAAVALPPSSGEGALQAGRLEQGSSSCLNLSQSVDDKYKCNARRSVAILKLPRTGSTWLVHALQHGQSATLGSAPRLSRLLWALPGRGLPTRRPAAASGARANSLQTRRLPRFDHAGAQLDRQVVPCGGRGDQCGFHRHGVERGDKRLLRCGRQGPRTPF